MALETRPQVGRPAMTAPEAARVMRLDVRTVRKLIAAGQLAGGAQTGPGSRRRWYVYVDQLPGSGALPSTTSPVDPHASEIAALRDENARLHAENTHLHDTNADLRAQLVSAEETNRQLLAAQATLREAVTGFQETMSRVVVDGVAGFQRAAEGYRAVADEYRGSAEHLHRAVTDLARTNSQLTSVLDRYGDALSQYTTPGHLGELPSTDQPPR